MRHAPEKTDDLRSRRWPIDVYLPDCVLSGVVEGSHRRLGDHLRSVDDLLTIDETVVRSLRSGADLTQKRSAIVTVQSILFVVDRSDLEPNERQSTMRIEKRTFKTMANVGPFWMRGDIHLPPAGDIQNYIRGSMGSFIPLTGVTISGHDQHNGRTVLMNRAHLRCLLT